ncbi:MAG: hypothetical protein FJZ43_04145 [Candidatus Staskawiczbacteria bacterium]|nr:hypothetical protein [Candidatus Staskawiczbacteria bacterium]
MKSKSIFFVFLFALLLLSFVSAVTYSENQEVTLGEGSEVLVQIQGANYKLVLDPFFGDRIGFEINGKQNDNVVGEGSSILLDNGITISVINIYQEGNQGFVTFKMTSQNLDSSQATRVQTPTREQTQEELNAVANRQQQERISSVLLIISLIVSLIVGIVLMVFMIKNSPKIPNLIIHGLVFLGSVIWFISMIFGLLFQFVKYGSIPDPDIIEIGWPSILLLLFSGYLTFNLIKKQNFAEKMKYALSLSSGGIIASVLAILSVIAIGFIFNLDGLGVGLMGILIFTVGAVGSFILGIIGFFIDKSHK